MMTLNELLNSAMFSSKAFLHLFTFGSAGVIMTDKRGNIIDGNPAFSRMMGYTREEFIGKTPKILLWSGHQNPDFYREMWNDIETSGHWIGKIWDTIKSKKIAPFLLSIKKMESEDGEIVYLGVYNEASTLDSEAPQNIKYYET